MTEWGVKALDQHFDFQAVLDKASDLGELITRSQRSNEYLSARKRVYGQQNVQEKLQQFELHKQQWEETERYGHFHPQYREALDRVQQSQQALDALKDVQAYVSAESALDELLHAVSRTIAYSVSDQIKVPSNKLSDNAGGCGGNCNGGCG